MIRGLVLVAAEVDPASTEVSWVGVAILIGAFLGVCLLMIVIAMDDAEAKIRRAYRTILDPPTARAREFPTCRLCDRCQVQGPGQVCGACLADWRGQLDRFDGARRGWQ